MERLFLFIYEYRAFFTFLVLEVFCFGLIVENNQYQGAKFYNSSNTVVASLNNFSQSIRDYFLLSEVNRSLAEENAALRKQLERKVQTAFADSIATDTAARYDYVVAKVVNNQVDRFKNFITINKGKDDGVEPGMAVISPLGIVGKVKLVSDSYGVVSSLLHIDIMVSAVLKRTNHFGTIQWDGKDPYTVKFNYIPRHVTPAIGDTVVTSGYNAVFPEGIMVGTIADIELRDEALSYDITVNLAQDFRKLSFVTIVKSHFRNEVDSLEQSVLELER